MSTGDANTIGPYELRGVLGRGGSATVYRGYDPALGREIAIKVLTMRGAQDGILRERFRREAQAIARLRHPNIVSIYASGEEGGVPYLVMELFPNGALARRLGRPLPPRDAAILARQIGAALDYAHGQGFVHRDVKPANIFLDGDRAVLADFGIVKAIAGEGETRLTETRLGVGTPEYTAPEQALGEPVDGRADLYALGIVLYELLTGAPPYAGSLLEVLNQHIAGAIPDPRRRNPALSPALAEILMRAIARQPAGRYQSGAALADALDAAIARGGDAGAGPAAPPDREARTMIVDLQRERLTGTQQGRALPRLPQSDQTMIAPTFPAPGGGTGRSTPAIQLPPLPDLTPAPAPRAAGGGAATGPTAAGQTPTPPPLAPPMDPGETVVLPGDSRATVSPWPSAPQPTTSQSQPWVTPPPQPMPQPLSQPMPLPAPSAQAVAMPPTPQARRGNGALIGGVAAAVVVLLLALGVGGTLWLRGQREATPTATVAAQRSPTVPVGGSPVAGGTATARGPATPSAAAVADPASPQIATGDQALAAGRFTEAVAAYKEALRINPQSAAANRQLGLTLWVWNHEPGEIEYLDRATKLAPDDPLAWAYLSFSAVDTHQVERAYGAAQQAVRADSERSQGYAAVANTYLRYPPNTADPDAAYRSAQEAIDRAKALDPDDIWTLWFDSQLLQTLGQYDRSLVPMNRLIELRPNWPTLYYAKGGIYRAQDKPDEARAWQEQALKLDPDYPFALTELGWLAYERGDYAAARDFFEHALRTTDDTNDYAHIGYGWTLMAQNDYVNAIARCKRAVGIDGRAPLGYECLGAAYLNDPQRLDESAANYRKVIELRPQWESGYIGVARVANAQRDFAAGESILRQGAERVKQPRYLTYWLGLMLFRQEKYEEAQPQFDRAVDLVPTNAVIHYQRALNLERLRRFPEARAGYERALLLDPSYQDAKDALERLRRQGN